MNLALEYRPRRFSEVVGQAHVVAVLRAMVKSGDVQPALLFSGSHGTGKTSVARIFASGLNCGSPDVGDPCGECESCLAVSAGRSSAVIEIDAASNGLVDDIRRLRELVQYQMIPGGWTVVLLDEAQSMSQEAYNALLKVLEEPPPQTVFILLTTEPHRILETVKSRCMSFTFRRIGDQMLVDRLRSVAEAEGINVQVEVLAEVARMSDGGLRDALTLLDQARRVDALVLDRFSEVFGVADIGFDLLEAALNREVIAGLDLLDQYFYYSGDSDELLRTLSKAVTTVMTRVAAGPGLEDSPVARLARTASPGQLMAAAKLLWDARTRISHLDPRTGCEMIFVLLGDAFHPQVPIHQAKEVPVSPAPVVRLSLAAMVEKANDALSG